MCLLNILRKIAALDIRNMPLQHVLTCVVLVVWALFSDSLPAKYKGRRCAGRAWKRAFPSASAQEIRVFLTLFVEAFAFNTQHRLTFNPQDSLLDIYHALYPHRWQADALEFETLDDTLQDHYHLSLDDIWHDGLTLGELFAAVQQGTAHQATVQQGTAHQATVPQATEHQAKV